MISAFPKIFSIGTVYIKDIFNEEVEATEKIDGSQFSFGKINGNLYLRSKGAMLYPDNPQKMFVEAMDYVQAIQDKLPDGLVFYCEYLQKPKHNTLAYSRIPKNHLMLFGVMDTSQRFISSCEWADKLEIEHVPIISVCKINNASELTALLDSESILGGVKIEGVVVKNFYRPFLLGGQPIPLMAGKYVSEKFKEINGVRWSVEENSKSKLQAFMDSFRTEARWVKAVQHLDEKGELGNQPSDIGRILREVQVDITLEEEQNIKQWLWGQFKGDILKASTYGLPEWYKNRLLLNTFTKEETYGHKVVTNQV